MRITKTKKQLVENTFILNVGSSFTGEKLQTVVTETKLQI